MARFPAALRHVQAFKGPAHPAGLVTRHAASLIVQWTLPCIHTLIPSTPILLPRGCRLRLSLVCFFYAYACWRAVRCDCVRWAERYLRYIFPIDMTVFIYVFCSSVKHIRLHHFVRHHGPPPPRDSDHSGLSRVKESMTPTYLNKKPIRIDFSTRAMILAYVPSNCLPLDAHRCAHQLK